MGKHFDYRQDSRDDIMDRAKAECEFTDRLYEILLAYQSRKKLIGRKPGDIPSGNVGELNPEMSRLYNLIWSAALPLNDKNSKKKQPNQMEVIA